MTKNVWKSSDFDEFCDPTKPKPIKYEDIEEAAKKLSEHIEPTPCAAAYCSKMYKMTLTYKLENINKSGSFKDRGCLNALLNLPEDKKTRGVIVGTLGNEGFAMSYHCKSLKIPVWVVMPTWIPIYYQEKCTALGATVILHGISLKDAMNHALSFAKRNGMAYINGRDHPHVLAGNGTIALEILKQVPDVEAILLPIGTGGLAAAVGTVVKADKPDCLIYGVQPEATPLFFKTLSDVNKTPPPKVVNKPTTLAESIAVTTLEANSLPAARSHVDKLLLVKEEWISRAMLHMFEKQHRMVEGAAACPLAAIFGGLVPELRSKNVVAIITGGNINTVYISRYLELGLAAEGRIVKFKVVTMDTNDSLLRLLDLLAKGEWDVLYQSQVHRWVATQLKFEINLVCRTKDLEHALKLRRLIQKEYPKECVFEHEIFTDNRNCECFVFRGITADKRPIKKVEIPDTTENPEKSDNPVKPEEDLSRPEVPGISLLVKDYLPDLEETEIVIFARNKNKKP